MFQLDNLEMYKNPLLNFMEISAKQRRFPSSPNVTIPFFLK